MQTFVPLPSFRASARTLDRQRLGKQRVEVLQLLRAGLGHTTGGWGNHPALKMWEGHLAALAGYGMVVCDEWISRGYRDTTKPKLWALWLEARAAGESVLVPSWWGRPDVHASHRGNLVRKDADHYGPQFPDADPGVEYVWPVTSPNLTAKHKRGNVSTVPAGRSGGSAPSTKEPIVAARGSKSKTKPAKPAPEEDLDLDDVDTDDVEDDETPAPKPAKRAKGSAKTKRAKVEVEVDDTDDDEDADDEPPAKPAKKAKSGKGGNGIEAAQAARAAKAPKFGTAQLAEHVNEVLGTSYTPFQLRAILRRMANDDASSLTRVVGETRERYSFTGPKDPQVKELIKRLKAGEIEKDKAESLAKLKERTAGKKGKKAAKAEPEPEVEDLDDDEEIEDDTDEEDDDE